MMEAMVTVEHLTKKFADIGGSFDVIRDASFTINKGEMVALIGISGSGKTTLLQILGGLDRPTSGTIRIGTSDLAAMSPRELAKFRGTSIGFVFQFHHLLPDFTALENILIPGLISGKSQKQCLPRARELLHIFKLDNRQSHYPAELSGGERQRIALARALFNEPALVLADEPTGNLDRANSDALLELIHAANAALHQTFLIATHNPELCNGMQRTIYIEDGNVISH